jgi:predicted TIM-barrel fold metal-dependent hydrolase
MTTSGNQDRLIVVSCDAHVGPRLKEDLRPLCPKEHLEAFDEFTKANENTVNSMRDPNNILEGRSTLASEVSVTRQYLNRQTKGHYDIDTRMKEMDSDGVAAEVIFHGSQNTEVFPFVGRREWLVHEVQNDLEVAAVGMRMYNRWLSEFVSVQPERHIGLAYLPLWDVSLAVKELEWAAEAGLRGVNFPAPRPGMAGEYDDPIWEPLWDACEHYEMSFATHAGVPTAACFGPQAMAMTRIEVAGWPARRGMHRLIFGGVFERHPKLKLILTEQSRGWWTNAMHEMDSCYANPSDALRAQVPKKPSEYMKSNVFIGTAFTPPTEVQEAQELGLVDHMLWGRDYPHGEGTYKFPESDDEPNLTRLYLHWAFAGAPREVAQKILGDNAIKAYHLDAVALQKVADRVGPTVDEVISPLDTVPPEWAWHLVDVQTGHIHPREAQPQHV